MTSRWLLVLALATACRGDRATGRPGAAPAKAPAALEVQVDRRVELFSILFRLAGANEYGQAAPTAYAAAVDRHFAPHRDHAAVKASRLIRAEAGVGFDAPMSLAIFLGDRLRPLAPLAPWPPGLDERWRQVDLDAYLGEVRRRRARRRHRQRQRRLSRSG